MAERTQNSKQLKRNINSNFQNFNLLLFNIIDLDLLML